MRLRFRLLIVLRIAGFCALCLAFAAAAFAQSEPAITRYEPPTFFQLTHNSGYIFSGTVMDVSRINSNLQSVGSVRITFHVENAIRGVRKGQTLVIHEWAGLWEMGEHYAIGEKVTLFLFPPGKLGLTSPVGGPFGKFKFDPEGYVLLNRGQISAISTDPVLSRHWQARSSISWQEFSDRIGRLAQE